MAMVGKVILIIKIYAQYFQDCYIFRKSSTILGYNKAIDMLLDYESSEYNMTPLDIFVT